MDTLDLQYSLLGVKVLSREILVYRGNDPGHWILSHDKCRRDE